MTDIREALRQSINYLTVSANELETFGSHKSAEILRTRCDEFRAALADGGWRDVGVIEWRPFSKADESPEPIVVYRPDAGIFMAQYGAGSQFHKGGDDAEGWWTLEGEDLTDDLPTHYAHYISFPKEPKS